MTRFTIHTFESAAEPSRPFLERARKGMGFVPNLYGVLAESPAALKAYASFGEVLQDTAFTTEERNLIWLAIARANTCAYCVAAHTVISSRSRVPEGHIQAIRDGLPLSDPKLQALRHFTEVVVERRGWAGDAEIEAFLAAGYSLRQVIEVVAFIAQKTLSTYLNHLAETPLDDAFASSAWVPAPARPDAAPAARA